ncbi:type IV toxin-antitoxin system AbiEi family antitoxin domain-containing protein [Mycobacterium hubeiense]|uniref:type IV toxin-antitoxin system AbiEi family antitoxin domain-containing protein n=1 Tax=Mycobacterium hubeiense TaxID=1867256 RepID=UPI000C7F3845|nr:type IV toxin-antitoxin system AbiEi family antitoxin domain-containing protein [Mycobacterium sp. QGD 101]
MLDEYLREQDGVLTLAQAQAAGLSKHAVNRRVLSGQWRPCSRGVYFAADRPFTDAARIRASVWSYGAHAAASGLAAAFWHNLTQFAPDIVEVTVPRNSSGRSHPGSRVRRRDLAPDDVVEDRRLRATSLPLTVIEAAVRRRGGAKLMDSALQRHVELRELWQAHLRNKGRYGSPAARLLLQAASDGARSQAERLLLKLLREAGITGWQANYPVGGYKVDVGFPDVTVAIEVDGLAFHSDSDNFHADRVRQNNIALLGWQVLRFTWLDLIEYPQRVIAIIRKAISA